MVDLAPVAWPVTGCRESSSSSADLLRRSPEARAVAPYAVQDDRLLAGERALRFGGAGPLGQTHAPSPQRRPRGQARPESLLSRPQLENGAPRALIIRQPSPSGLTRHHRAAVRLRYASAPYGCLINPRF
jgi:hypothetical protein